MNERKRERDAPFDAGRPHWWTPSASLHARLGASAAACYVLLAGFSLQTLPIVKITTKDLKRWGPSHRDTGRLLGVLMGAAMLTGWYKRYFAINPALFAALAGQFVAACAWLGGGGGGGVKGATSKRFDPWQG